MCLGIGLTALCWALPQAAKAAGATMREETTALLPPGDLTPQSVQQIDMPLPSVLGPRDVERYKRIFELQEEAKWHQADKLIAALDNPILKGHALFQRYLHPTGYRSKYGELRDWLEAYGDHPGAHQAYALAVKRRPKAAGEPPRPPKGYLAGSGPGHLHGPVEPQHVLASQGENLSSVGRAMLRQVKAMISRGAAEAALKHLASPAGSGLDAEDRAHSLAEIAHGFFLAGNDELALKHAKQSLAAAKGTVPTAHWTAGLASWRRADYSTAANHFEALARGTEASRWVKAAGAYWASRAHLAERRPRQATMWLAQAATHPGTFYGLLARRALGIELPLDWSLPALTGETMRTLREEPGAERAFALIQIGKLDLAEKELRRIYPNLPEYLHGPIMTIAARAGIPGLAMRIAGILRARGDRPYYAAFYPLPDWEIENAAGIDKALIYAIARQESNFEVNAQSGRGAIGVMQLMPHTAAFVANDRSLTSADGRKQLMDPALNLKLAQQYVGHLLEQDSVNAGLFQLLAAYNAGPGTLKKWTRNVDFKEDPLLFIESIPRHETREFIERVLTNLWMYRLRLGQPVQSLDDIAAGSWPRYESYDETIAQGEPQNARN